MVSISIHDNSLSSHFLSSFARPNQSVFPLHASQKIYHPNVWQLIGKIVWHVLSNNWPIIHMIITTQITTKSSHTVDCSILTATNIMIYHNNQENGHSSPFRDNFHGKFHICLCVDPQAIIPQTSHEVVACSFFGRLHLAQGDAPRSEEQNPQMSCKYSMGLSENSVPLNPMVNDHYPY